MKRVLIPTFCFYPLNTGGTFRLASFARYLLENGWEPIVVAPDWTQSQLKKRNGFDPSMADKDPCRVERVPFLLIDDINPKTISKILGGIIKGERYHYGTLPTATLEKCRQICQTEKIDALFASSLPQYIHWIAHHIYKEFKIPWIADFRDLIDQEKITKKNTLSYMNEYIMRKQFIFRDHLYTRSASAITIVSEGLAEKISKRTNTPVSVIMNGFDPNDFTEKDMNTKSNEKFTIVYGGCLYGNREPSIFLKGIDLFLDTNPNLEEKVNIVFYGMCCDNMKIYIENMTHPNVVRLDGVVPHNISIKKTYNADVLYFMSHPSKGIVSGKIFEYLASGRPIMSVPGDGDVTDRIINDTKSGFIATSPQEVSEIINMWYLIWNKEREVNIKQNKEQVYKYTRQKQSMQLSKLLNKIIPT